MFRLYVREAEGYELVRRTVTGSRILLRLATCVPTNRAESTKVIFIFHLLFTTRVDQTNSQRCWNFYGARPVARSENCVDLQTTLDARQRLKVVEFCRIFGQIVKAKRIEMFLERGRSTGSASY